MSERLRILIFLICSTLFLFVVAQILWMTGFDTITIVKGIIVVAILLVIAYIVSVVFHVLGTKK